MKNLKYDKKTPLCVSQQDKNGIWVYNIKLLFISQSINFNDLNIDLDSVCTKYSSKIRCALSMYLSEILS